MIEIIIMIAAWWFLSDFFITPKGIKSIKTLSNEKKKREEQEIRENYLRLEQLLK